MPQSVKPIGLHSKTESLVRAGPSKEKEMHTHHLASMAAASSATHVCTLRKTSPSPKTLSQALRFLHPALTLTPNTGILQITQISRQVGGNRQTPCSPQKLRWNASQAEASRGVLGSAWRNCVVEKPRHPAEGGLPKWETFARRYPPLRKCCRQSKTVKVKGNGTRSGRESQRWSPRTKVTLVLFALPRVPFARWSRVDLAPGESLCSNSW